MGLRGVEGALRMNLKIEVDCTPEEARAFLGLPDVSGLNAHLIEEMKKRMDSNMNLLQPDELMKAWMESGSLPPSNWKKVTSLTTSGSPVAWARAKASVKLPDFTSTMICGLAACWLAACCAKAAMGKNPRNKISRTRMRWV